MFSFILYIQGVPQKGGIRKLCPKSKIFFFHWLLFCLRFTETVNRGVHRKVPNNKIGKIWCMKPLHSFNNGNSLSELPAIMHGNLTVGRCWQRKYTLLLFCCIWDGYMQGLKTSLITIGIKNLAFV